MGGGRVKGGCGRCRACCCIRITRGILRGVRRFKALGMRWNARTSSGRIRGTWTGLIVYRIGGLCRRRRRGWCVTTVWLEVRRLCCRRGGVGLSRSSITIVIIVARVGRMALRHGRSGGIGGRVIGRWGEIGRCRWAVRGSRLRVIGLSPSTTTTTTTDIISRMRVIW